MNEFCNWYNVKGKINNTTKIIPTTEFTFQELISKTTAVAFTILKNDHNNNTTKNIINDIAIPSFKINNF